MGAKNWMLAYSDGDPAAALRARPALDREASAALAAKLFPGGTLQPLADADLTQVNPPDDEILVGVFPGITILAAKEFGIDYPSKLAPRFLEHGRERTIHLHTMHSVVNFFAFAVWERGALRRALSVAPDNGVIEDIGAKLPFEVPFWEQPPEEGIDCPYPFDALDLGEAARQAFFAHVLEGFPEPADIEPETVPLLCFARPRPKPWWKFW